MVNKVIVAIVKVMISMYMRSNLYQGRCESQYPDYIINWVKYTSYAGAGGVFVMNGKIEMRLTAAEKPFNISQFSLCVFILCIYPYNGPIWASLIMPLLIMKNKTKVVEYCCIMFRSIDDVLSRSNFKLGDYHYHSNILNLKQHKPIARPDSYFNLFIYIDSEYFCLRGSCS